MGKFIIFIFLSAILIFTGINWGLPSRKITSLYLNNKTIEIHIKTIEKYPTEKIYTGIGPYLVKYPESGKEKLPRNLYNPIRSYHPDEYFVIKSLSTMEPTKFNFNPHQFAVGGVYLYLIGLLLFFFSKIKIIKLTKDIGYYFLNPDEFAKFYIIGRTITGIYAIGIICLVYLISKKFENNNIKSLAPSILLLLTPLFILNSHYMYVDIPGVFWIVFSIYFALSYIENDKLKDLILSSIGAGLASGTKVTFAVSYFIPFVSLVFNSKDFKNFLKNFICSFLTLFVTFSITNPYFWITFPDPFIELSEHTPLKFSGLFYLNSLKFGLGMPLLLFCLIGSFFNRRTYLDKKALLLLLWNIFFFFFISLFSKNFCRYILPIIPSFIILGVLGWFDFYKKITPFFKKILSLLFICVLLFTFIYGMSYEMLFIKENIRTEAGIWIKENIPPGSSIGVTEVPWQFQLPPFDYYTYKVEVTGYNIEELKKRKPEYFILSSFQAPVPPYPMRLQKERVEFYKEFIESELYAEEKKFEKYPSFAGIIFKIRQLPEDLIYLNPSIVVFKKKGK